MELVTADVGSLCSECSLHPWSSVCEMSLGCLLLEFRRNLSAVAEAMLYSEDTAGSCKILEEEVGDDSTEYQRSLSCQLWALAETSCTNYRQLQFEAGLHTPLTAEEICHRLSV